ncbi:unnamed protein product [Trichobilharzia regenti]|nr:unnamed protein product [Trichobilharzia regenti]
MGNQNTHISDELTDTSALSSRRTSNSRRRSHYKFIKKYFSYFSNNNLLDDNLTKKHLKSSNKQFKNVNENYFKENFDKIIPNDNVPSLSPTFYTTEIGDFAGFSSNSSKIDNKFEINSNTTITEKHHLEEDDIFRRNSLKKSPDKWDNDAFNLFQIPVSPPLMSTTNDKYHDLQSEDDDDDVKYTGDFGEENDDTTEDKSIFQKLSVNWLDLSHQNGPVGDTKNCPILSNSEVYKYEISNMKHYFNDRHGMVTVNMHNKAAPQLGFKRKLDGAWTYTAYFRSDSFKPPSEQSFNKLVKRMQRYAYGLSRVHKCSICIEPKCITYRGFLVHIFQISGGNRYNIIRCLNALPAFVEERLITSLNKYSLKCSPVIHRT